MDSSTPLCLFTGRVESRDGEYVLTIPEQEVELGTLEPGDTYRVGVYPGISTSSTTTDDRHATGTDRDASNTRSDGEQAPSTTTRDSLRSASPNTASPPTSTDRTPDQPPVTEGETLRVQIEDVGDQGDGLARVGPGYVVFVPDTEIGQQPLVRVTTVRENFAFAEIVEE